MLSRWKNRRSESQKALAAYTFFAFLMTLLPLYAGGFTTTIGAGMVFPDWPFSNGSLNPPGWTTDQAMAAEHGHRLLAATSGFIMIILAIWMYLREERRWLRHLSYFALGLVIFQGLLGGLRVLLVSLDLAKIHGVIAQLFLCTLVAIAAGSARWWRRVPLALADDGEARAWKRQRQWGVALVALIVAQLVVGSIMRHRGAGLAIPYFPFSTDDGALLPAFWSWAVAVHFLHRVMALVITVVLLAWVWQVVRAATPSRAMKQFALAAAALLVVQIALGAEIIWSLRAPIQTTLHVLNGALLLSAVWVVVFAYFRPALEGLREPRGKAVAGVPELGGTFTPQRT